METGNATIRTGIGLTGLLTDDETRGEMRRLEAEIQSFGLSEEANAMLRNLARD